MRKYLLSGLVGLFIASFQVQASPALFKALASADSEQVTALIVADKQLLEARDDAGNTALLLAARQGQVQLVARLLELGAKADVVNNRRRDVLNMAVTAGSPEIVRLALAAGADVSLVTSVYQGSALIYATHQGQLEIVELLIEAGAPLNRVNNLGWTALLEAAILGDGSERYVAIVTRLLAAGADPSIADKQGKTPLDHARLKGHSRLAAILAEAH